MTTVIGHDFGNTKCDLSLFSRELRVVWTTEEALEAMKLVHWLLGGRAIEDYHRQIPWVHAILEMKPDAPVNAICDFGLKRAFDAFEKEVMAQRGFVQPPAPLPRRVQKEKLAALLDGRLPSARILTNRFLSSRPNLSGAGILPCHQAERGEGRLGTIMSLVDGRTDLYWVRHDDAGTPAVYLLGEFQVL